MRPVHEITAEEENFRGERFSPNPNVYFIKRDPVEAEPVGTLIMCAFRITGYDQDCDGSLMARLEQIDKEGETTGWRPDHLGLYPDVDLVVSLKELKELFERK